MIEIGTIDAPNVSASGSSSPPIFRRLTGAVFTPLNRIAERLFTRPVWGVARTSLWAMLRNPPAVVTMLILAAFLIWLPNMQAGGGALAGRVQQYLQFQDLLSNRVQQYLSLSLTAVYYLGSVLIVLLAAGVIVGEIQTRVIQLTLSKPIRRWQYVLGKGLALGILTFLLVFGAGAIIYLRLLWLTHEPATAADRERLVEQVLVTRESLPLAMPEKELQEAIAAREKQIEGERSEIGRQWSPEEEQLIKNDLLTQFFSIPPGQAKTYVFTGLTPAHQLQQYQLRYQVDLGGRTPNQDLLPVIFFVGDRTKAAQVRADRLDLVRVPHTFTLPADTIAKDGTLAVTVVNPNIRSPELNWETTINLPQKDGLAILYRVGGFEDNYFRGLLLIWFYLLLLGALGLFFSALVTYPVAVLCAATGLLTLLLVPWTAPTLVYLTVDSQRNDWFMNLTLPLSQLLARIVPDLSRLDPIDSLAGGVLVPWMTVGTGLLKLVLVGGGVLVMLAMFGLSRREVAGTMQN